MITTVSSINLWSCGLACIESILSDNGRAVTQAEMLESLKAEFPAWENQPGLLSGADFDKVFAGVGFKVAVLVPNSFSESIQLMQAPETVGGILATSKFWGSAAKDSLIELNHAMRLVDANGNGVTLMNPYRSPAPGAIENYSWSEIDQFKCQVFVFQSQI